MQNFHRKQSSLTRSWVLAVITLTMTIISSCSEEHSETPNLQPEQQLQNFKGLAVKHHYQSSPESFDFAIEDYQTMLLDQLNSKTSPNGRTYLIPEDLESFITLDLIAAIAEKHIHKYPNLWDMTEKDHAILKADFPTMSDEELDQNLDLIDQYYENNLRYDIVNCLADTMETVENATHNRIVAKCYDGDDYFAGRATCTKEVWFGVWHSQAVKDIKDARDKAFQYEKDFFGKNTGYTMGDAFRHSIWNTLIAKYYADRKKDVSKGVDIAKDFTNLHEECNNECGAEDWDIAMDKHNNFVGRDYFKNNASIKKTGKRPFRKKKLFTLSDDEFSNGTKSKADVAIKVAKEKSEIESTDQYRLVYFE